MKHQKLFLFSMLGAAALLTACQPSVPKFERYLSTWIGKSEAQLVTTWGAPTNMETIAPNRQIFVYIQDHEVNAAGNAPVDQALGQDSLFTQNNDALGTVYDYYCKITFTTQDDIIVDYAWSGDACLMK